MEEVWCNQSRWKLRIAWGMDYGPFHLFLCFQMHTHPWREIKSGGQLSENIQTMNLYSSLWPLQISFSPKQDQDRLPLWEH
jgi:hypothetical protein